ncbi:MAG TPA: arginine--tRNA ligase, partial [Lachnospiraceae bacterium]|nr:arginine--tRNA ligase [Lachnospiraceae bacterium]
MDTKEVISEFITKYLNGFTKEEIKYLIEMPTNPEMGDFSLPCFAMAKKLRKAPVKIAEDLKVKFEEDKVANIIHEVRVVNGYLNFFINREFYIEKVFQTAMQVNYGASNEGNGKVICMDYSSPNISKNFHVGHLRTTIIGNSLYHIYSKLGYQVVRINHLGDWGTQCGKLIVAYKKWSSKEQVKEKGIDELLRIYVMFGAEAEKNPILKEEARVWFAKMEKGDEEALSIWKWFKDISMIEFERIYKLLGVEFDSYNGESFYMDKVPVLVEELKEKGLLVESQGANIIDLEEYGMAPCLITKKDGSSIYHSRDIAAILYRKNKYHFDKCLYVTGVEQKLHFAQVFKAVELMGYDYYENLVHIPYGLVSLEGAKLSTRSGNIIYAEDILKEAIERSASLIEQKNPSLYEKESVARKVGIGAVIFHDLYNQRIKDVNFSWDDILNFEGSTGPYAQYTYARANSILRKVGKIQGEISNYKVDCKLLLEEASYALIKVIALYPEKIYEAAERYEPSIITRYIINLATTFNRFYH